MRFGWVLIPLLSFIMAVVPGVQDVEANFKSTGSLPLCDDYSVLKRISKRFRVTQRHYNKSDLELLELHHIHETGERIVDPEETDRRFCTAKGELSNGEKPTVYYMILEQGGLASIGWGFDYCVSGYDVQRAHGANCRSLRAPF